MSRLPGAKLGRWPTPHELLMTDLPNVAADQAGDASRPDSEAPVGDPELAALVGSDAPDAPLDAADQAVGDPELASLVQRDATTSDTAASDVTTTFEVGVDAVPVLPLAAAVSDGESPKRPRRRRSLALRFGVSFVVGFLIAIGIGVGGLYVWGQQYEGRILPGVRVGGTDLGGLTRDEAGAALATAYAPLANGQITLTDPDGQTTTISYADVGRGPDTQALLDAALAAGRQGDPVTNLVSAPQAAIHGVTIDPTVAAYDRDKLAAAVENLAKAVDQAPSDASVSTGQALTFDVVPSTDGRAVDKTALLTALDQPLAALGTSESIAMAVPVVKLAPAVATASAEAAKAAAARMAADLVVTRGKEDWTIGGASLAPLISFSTAADGSITPVLDESGLDPILKSLAKKVNQKVKDASLRLVNGHIVATGTSREGRTLKADEMKAALLSEIGARQAGSAAAPLAAIVKATDPKLTSADAKAFAPKMRVISKYSVFYWVLINNHFGGNIEAPATKINGTVVPAGGKVRLLEGRRRPAQAPGRGPGQRHRRREDHRHRRVRWRHLHHVHDVVQRGIPGRHGAARAKEPQRVHHPVPGGPRCHRVDRRQDQADDELQERHQVPDPDPADHHACR